jgi:hypothetical protein
MFSLSQPDTSIILNSYLVILKLMLEPSCTPEAYHHPRWPTFPCHLGRSRVRSREHRLEYYSGGWKLGGNFRLSLTYRSSH